MGLVCYYIERTALQGGKFKMLFPNKQSVIFKVCLWKTLPNIMILKIQLQELIQTSTALYELELK